MYRRALAEYHAVELVILIGVHQHLADVAGLLTMLDLWAIVPV